MRVLKRTFNSFRAPRIPMTHEVTGHHHIALRDEEYLHPHRNLQKIIREKRK